MTLCSRPLISYLWFCFWLYQWLCPIYPQCLEYCAPTYIVYVAMSLDHQSKLCKRNSKHPPYKIGANFAPLLHCHTRFLVSSVPSSRPAVDFLLLWPIWWPPQYLAPLLHCHTRFPCFFSSVMAASCRFPSPLANNTLHFCCIPTLDS